MNTRRILVILLFHGGCITRALAQDNPAPATEAAQTEMQKWIATTDAQWLATFNREVIDAHAAELKKLAGQYAVSLDAALAKATAAGDLDGAVALRNEQKRFTETNVFPEQDDAAEAASVKQIRAATRVQLAKIEQQNAARTKALHAKYDAVLAQGQAQLTQAKRLDDALLVKNKREEVAAAWITPAITAALGNAGPPKIVAAPKPAATAKPAVKPPGTQGTRRITFKATVDAGDNVVIQDGKLHIEHIDWTKPLGISVNGMKWEPVWQGKLTDDFTKFTPPLAPFAGAQVTARFTQKKKKDGSVKVIEQPTEANGQKLVVHIQDEGGGASDFEVHITW